MGRHLVRDGGAICGNLNSLLLCESAKNGDFADFSIGILYFFLGNNVEKL